MTKRWLRITCLGLCCLAGTVWADPRVEARRHFKTGMALIQEGRYDEGVAELLAAYAVRPHPNVLFNIAKAYENGGRIPEAIAYLHRYLDANPPDAAEVSETLEKLEAKEAREAAKREPPRPPPEPKKESRPAAPPPEEVPSKRMSELAERLEKALTKAEKATEPATPAPPVEKPAPAPEEVNRYNVPYEETVVSASRRAQSTLEAPNSITVITGDEIRASGLQSLPEILRRVPGAEVMALDYSSADVSFRGFNQRNSNKVLVLIDGRPEYQDFLAVTLWQIIPIGLEEIERVEVIRGPGSALYGANAVLGVVNIVTRSPGTGPKAEVTALGGNAGLAAGSVVASGGDRLLYRVSAGYAQGNKYSRDYANDRADMRSNAADPNLSLRSARANASFFYAFNRDISLSLAGGVNRLYAEFYASGLLRNYFIDGVAGYAKLDLTLGPVKVRSFWNSANLVATPQYEPYGTRSLAMSIVSNIFDAEIFFQKEFELAGTHMLAAGLSGRLKNLAWSYVGPVKDEFHAAAFLQEEWRPFKMLSLVASYRVDRHPLLDSGNPGYAQSPRVSIVVTPVEGHAFRASFATAFRAPSFAESYLDLRTPVPGIGGASVATRGNLALRPERLLSFEVGYRGELARIGLSWDLALYWNIVADLIYLSEVKTMGAGSAYDAATGSYFVGHSAFVNDSQGPYTARGGELGVTWNALPGLDLRLSGALQSVESNTPGTACGPCTQAPTAKVNGGFVYRTPVGLDLSADFSYASATIWVEREPARVNPTQILFVQNPLAAYTVLNARVGYRLFNDRLTLALVGSQLGPDHQEHPLGNSVNRRLFATITVQP